MNIEWLLKKKSAQFYGTIATMSYEALQGNNKQQTIESLTKFYSSVFNLCYLLFVHVHTGGMAKHILLIISIYYIAKSS